MWRESCTPDCLSTRRFHKLNQTTQRQVNEIKTAAIRRENTDPRLGEMIRQMKSVAYNYPLTLSTFISSRRQKQTALKE